MMEAAAYLTIFSIGILCNVVPVNSCGIKMPEFLPPSFRGFMTQSRWNLLRAVQLQQLSKNNLCNENPKDNPFVCIYRKRKLVTRQGVCTVHPETETPMCFWKENNDNPLEGRSSLGFDFVRCLNSNRTRTSDVRRVHTHRPRSLNFHNLLHRAGANLLNRTHSHQGNLLLSAHPRPQSNPEQRETVCFFDEIVELKREGLCVRLGKNSGSRFPNLPSYACQNRTFGEMDIGNEDCSFLA